MTNKLHGAIPTQLFSSLDDGKPFAPKSKHFLANNMKLSGPIPTEIGRFTQMEALDVCSNAINGSFPTQLARLTGLKVLAMAQNNIHGTLPQSLNMSKLELFSLAHNQ